MTNHQRTVDHCWMVVEGIGIAITDDDRDRIRQILDVEWLVMSCPSVNAAERYVRTREP